MVAGKNSKNLKQTKLVTQLRVRTPDVSSKSRFVPCPVCGAEVLEPLINEHLDKSCLAQQRREDTKASASVSKAQQSGWWKQGPGAPQNVASARLCGDKDKQQLTLTELQQAVPCELVLSVLPRELADTLLKDLIGRSENWERGSWFMFGKAHAAPRTSCYFDLSCEQSGEVQSSGDAVLDVSEDVSTAPAPESLREAARVVNQAVTVASRRVEAQLMPEDRFGWESSYALANCYRDGSEGVGPHSDRLQTLGPRTVIASLSLGATRTFRLTRARPKADPRQAATGSAPPGAGSELASGSSHESSPSGGAPCTGRQVESVDVPLAHNTLVVMWPPTQEEWKHEVPKSKSVQRHPISGLLRMNLTFRKLKRGWVQRAPQCRCHRQAVLKAALGHGTGATQQYYYQCDNTKGAACGFWKWVTASEIGL